MAIDNTVKAGFEELARRDTIQRLPEKLAQAQRSLEDIGEELEQFIAEIVDTVIGEHSEILQALQDPDSYTIFVDNIEGKDLREAGVAEDIIALFLQADTEERKTIIDQLLEPVAVFELYEKVITRLEHTVKSFHELLEDLVVIDPIAMAKQLKRELLEELKTATGKTDTESTKAKGWITPKRDILEQATKKEARETTDENTLRLVFGTSGEYPDGTKWERDATPDEEAEYKSYME